MISAPCDGCRNPILIVGVAIAVPHLRCDESTKQPKCVMDIGSPSMGDIHQVIAYAEAISCREAILIYPIETESSLDTWVGNIHIRSATFSLEGDLDEAGRDFVHQILGS